MFTNVEWYTTNETINNLIFGYLHLIVSGTTNGEKVAVITYGDGVISDRAET